jgi:transcriptional regulator with XRE-family HTH domain
MLRRELENWSARTGQDRAAAAASIGVSYRTLSLWLAGSCTPRPPHIKAIADLLGIDPVALLDEFRKRAA